MSDARVKELPCHLVITPCYLVSTPSQVSDARVKELGKAFQTGDRVKVTLTLALALTLTLDPRP